MCPVLRELVVQLFPCVKLLYVTNEKVETILCFFLILLFVFQQNEAHAEEPTELPGE